MPISHRSFTMVTRETLEILSAGQEGVLGVVTRARSCSCNYWMLPNVVGNLFLSRSYPVCLQLASAKCPISGHFV